MRAEKIKKILAEVTALLAVASMFAFTSCGSENKDSNNSKKSNSSISSSTDSGKNNNKEKNENFKKINLGTSNISISIPDSYKKGSLSKEDTSECQVAYYKSDESLMDFDIYHWAKSDNETLEDTAKEEAEIYGSDVKEKEINSIKLAYYESVEKIDDGEFSTLTYIAEDGDYFVEVVFWLDGDTAREEADKIMDTIEQKETNEELNEGEIRLGTSSFLIKTENNYQKGKIDLNDTDENQVGYYFSEDSKLDFDVYHWARADGETIDDAIKEEADLYGAEIKEREINGIKLKYYETEEEDEETTYKTLTYIAEDGEYFVEIVFWLDGEEAVQEAEQIITTLLIN